ncbi:HAMP domain-containing protein [Desulfococcaceae bacterium HSG9]|nr:HAMP domain-containing protein [Desulfococcaceae bacterium HSG9]
MTKNNLQRTMIIYFLLIGFASLLVGIEFIVDTQSSALKETLLDNFSKYANQEIGADAVFAPIVKLRNKAILMVAIILVVMIIILTMFIKNITEPLQHMIEISRNISRGDLSQTVTIDSQNELAQLGNVINEMSSNLQEITLLSQNLCESGQTFTTQASNLLNETDIDAESITLLKEKVSRFESEMDMLTEVIDYFNFYTVERSDDE